MKKMTLITAALLLSFALTAFCGMAMSSYALPFLYGIVKITFSRRMHLSMSYWAFVLMGLQERNSRMRKEADK